MGDLIKGPWLIDRTVSENLEEALYSAALKRGMPVQVVPSGTKVLRTVERGKSYSNVESQRRIRPGASTERKKLCRWSGRLNHQPADSIGALYTGCKNAFMNEGLYYLRGWNRKETKSGVRYEVQGKPKTPFDLTISNLVYEFAVQTQVEAVNFDRHSSEAQAYFRVIARDPGVQAALRDAGSLRHSSLHNILYSPFSTMLRFH